MQKKERKGSIEERVRHRVKRKQIKNAVLLSAYLTVGVGLIVMAPNAARLLKYVEKAIGPSPRLKRRVSQKDCHGDQNSATGSIGAVCKIEKPASCGSIRTFSVNASAKRGDKEKSCNKEHTAGFEPYETAYKRRLVKDDFRKSA